MWLVVINLWKKIYKRLLPELSNKSFIYNHYISFIKLSYLYQKICLWSSILKLIIIYLFTHHYWTKCCWFSNKIHLLNVQITQINSKNMKATHSCRHRSPGVKDLDSVLHWGASVFGQKGSSGLFLSTQVSKKKNRQKKNVISSPTAKLSPLDFMLFGWHLLYVRRDVVFRPFLPEREEVVEALQRVLWKVLHPQQADGLRVGAAVHQGDALQHWRRRGVRNETTGATHSSPFRVSGDWWEHELDGRKNV